jgi:hypothetical protein
MEMGENSVGCSGLSVDWRLSSNSNKLGYGGQKESIR